MVWFWTIGLYYGINNQRLGGSNSNSSFMGNLIGISQSLTYYRSIDWEIFIEFVLSTVI